MLVFPAVKMEVDDLWLFSKSLSIYVSAIGVYKTSMLKNKMLERLRNVRGTNQEDTSPGRFPIPM